MIRINLLATQRKAKKSGAAFNLSGQAMTIGCSLILAAAVGLIGWRYWALGRESAQLDAAIAAAQQETGRLHSVIAQVQQFEQRRAQLQQRVVLIEQLRKGQTGPVHMLDQVSRALPPMLWLTELKQNDKVPGEVIIDGRCTTLTGLSDFVANLEASGYFKKSVEIVSTAAEQLPQPPGELIRFTIRAVFQTPGETKPADAGTPAARVVPAARTGGD
jgi:type IV pilus assembly protein PilN